MDTRLNADVSAKSDDPDLELVARAKKELPTRTSAYEELVRRHEKLLYRVCRRIMGNDNDADDVFQDSMLKVYHGIPKFEYRSSFKTWLFTIAHNTCYTAIKRLSKAQEYRNAFEHAEINEEQQETSDVELDTETILMSLKLQDRELLTLKYVGELSFEEIAEIVGLGVSAVKMRIYRSAELLREKHSEYQELRKH